MQGGGDKQAWFVTSRQCVVWGIMCKLRRLHVDSIVIYINPLKPDIHLNSILKFSSYLTQNTLYLNYKVQKANNMHGNNLCLLWE
jgi:hypothetical protein